MATIYSDQAQKSQIGGNPLVNGFTERDTYRRTDFFTRNTTSTYGNAANGDVLVLTRLPKGAVILSGTVTYGALGAGVTATLAVNGQALAAAATSVAAAGAIALASTQALGYGYTLPADADVTLTIGGAAPAASIAIAGSIDYLWN